MDNSFIRSLEQYSAAMHQARQLLRLRIITQDEYNKFNTIFTKQYAYLWTVFFGIMLDK